MCFTLITVSLGPHTSHAGTHTHKTGVRVMPANTHRLTRTQKMGIHVMHVCLRVMSVSLVRIKSDGVYRSVCVDTFNVYGAIF